MYDSYIAPAVAKHKVTPRAFHHRANREPAFDRPGFLPRFGVVDKTNDGRERIRRQVRDIGPPLAGRMAANHEALVRMAQRVLDRNIQVVLIRMPTHETYRDNRPDEWLQAYDQQLKDLQTRFADKGVVFWNLEEDNRLTDEDFFDGDHLNAGGAAKFARILDQMIQPLVKRTADAQTAKSAQPVAPRGPIRSNIRSVEGEPCLNNPGWTVICLDGRREQRGRPQVRRRMG